MWESKDRASKHGTLFRANEAIFEVLDYRCGFLTRFHIRVTRFAPGRYWIGNM